MRQRLQRAAFAQISSLALAAVQRLVELPLFLYFWGAQCYGEWLAIVAVAEALTLTDSAISATARNELARRSSAVCREQLRNLYTAALAVSIVLAGAIVFCIYTVVSTVDWVLILSLQEIGDSFVSISLLAASGASLKIMRSSVLTGFCAIGEYPRLYMIEVYLVALNMVMTIGVLIVGGGPVVLISVIAGTNGVSLLICAGFVWRTIPWMTPAVGSISGRSVVIILRPALGRLAFPAGWMLNNAGVKLVVAGLLGPVAVAQVSAARTLVNVVAQIAGAISRTVQPEFAIAAGLGDFKRARRLHRASSQLSFWVCLPIVLILSGTMPSVISMWTFDRLTIPVAFGVFLGGSLFLRGLWQACLTPALSVNQVWFCGMVFVLCFGLGVVISSAFLGMQLGISGVGLGIFLGEVLMFICIIPVGTRIAGDAPWSWLHATVSPPPLRRVRSFLRHLGGRFG